MLRIAIIGCGGSGKSTLARRMGKELALPVFHLDRLYWKEGWVATPKDEWTALQEALCARPRWIIDGNYGGTMEARLSRADTIVFLDLPTLRCLSGAVRRYVKYRGRTRPELAAGCRERLTVEYLCWICTYRRRRRPGILRTLREIRSQKQIVILESRRAADDFVRRLQGPAGRRADMPTRPPNDPVARSRR